MLVYKIGVSLWKQINIMYYQEDNYYQSQEWVNIQQEMEEDETSASIMDDFKK